MKKAFKRWALWTIIVLTSLSTLSPVLSPSLESASAQVTSSQTTNQSLDIENQSSEFPTVSYREEQAKLPSDGIVVDPDTLFSDQTLSLDQYYDEIVTQQQPPYSYQPKDYIRDLTTYTTLYIYYQQASEVEVLAPINLAPGQYEFFDNLQLANGNLWDILFKTRRVYHNALTDDIYEAFNLPNLYTPAMMADVTADKMRIDYILEQTDPDDPYYDQIEEVAELAEQSYTHFANHYNKQALDQVEPYYGLSDKVQASDLTDEIQATIEEALEPVPDHVKEKIGYIGIVARDELITSWNYSRIDAFATPEMNLFFCEDNPLSFGLFYHELGHIIDYASQIYENASSENYQSFSNSDEFIKVFEAEWDEEGSYYQTLVEAFAQGFGSYALEYYKDESMDEIGFKGYGLEGRPLTRAYFEQLFQDLDL